MDWTTNSIRDQFLKFFEAKQHQVVASAPMVLKDDPTLMFTNAGMNQFKDVFLGVNNPKNPRVADSQKCLRVSGKHNDLEEVGVDTYHHTMFEMLGNWSFGDYFKQEAIDWAWELLTEVYKIDKDRLYVTVFEGDKEDGLSADTEAEQMWKSHISADRIIRASKKDNFWEMGETGPCGPCSEIHVDIRPDEERSKLDGLSLVNQDHPQVVEIWNLVFMEYNRKANRSLEQLPAKHVDTGMGLERLAMVLQGKTSNYDIDLFQALIKSLEKNTELKYSGTDSKKDIAFRVIADHVRAVAFSIADGQLPSNTGAGYVIRRILRRAVRYGYSFLDCKESHIFKLIQPLTDLMGNAYPELGAQTELVTKVIQEEEESFLRTLSKGIDRLNKLIEGQDRLSGQAAFELYDTFGFPIDLTQLICSENKVEVDLNGFELELAKQKNRSKSSNELKMDDWVTVGNEAYEGFIGYDSLSESSKILRYRKVQEKSKEFFQLVLNKTPFYPEGGGQVGDTGYLTNGDEKIEVIDTQKENDLIVHKTTKLSPNLTGEWKSFVNNKKRILTTSNHSATHLLHYVLRKQLGEHVEQKGSLVNQKMLRFDFSHFEKLSAEQLSSIESEINELIAKGEDLKEYRDIPIEEAKSRGAMSLFGEKYGDKVRMIQFGNSKELCGGTHVQNTRDIVRFKIVSESSIAAGIRRIEAITNEAVFELYEKNQEQLNVLNDMFGNPKNLIQAVDKVLKENKDQKLVIEQFQKAQFTNEKQRVQNEIKQIGDFKFVGTEVNLNAGQIKDLCFQLKKEHEGIVAVLGSANESKVSLSILVSENLLSQLNAKELIKECSPLIQGGGGGQDFFATAGGKNRGGIKSSIELVEARLGDV